MCFSEAQIEEACVKKCIDPIKNIRITFHPLTLIIFNPMTFPIDDPTKLGRRDDPCKKFYFLKMMNWESRDDENLELTPSIYYNGIKLQKRNQLLISRRNNTLGRYYSTIPVDSALKPTNIENPG